MSKELLTITALAAQFTKLLMERAVWSKYFGQNDAIDITIHICYYYTFFEMTGFEGLSHQFFNRLSRKAQFWRESEMETKQIHARPARPTKKLPPTPGMPKDQVDFYLHTRGTTDQTRFTDRCR